MPPHERVPHKRSLLESHFVFLLLLSSFVFLPVASRGKLGTELLQIFFQVLLVGSVLSVVRNRVFLAVALALVVASTLARLSPVLPIEVRNVWGNALALPFLGILISVSTSRLLRADHVDAALVSSALSLYLLIGLFWFLAYGVVEWAEPGSFALHGAPLARQGVELTDELFYFSYVTLTTLGYGDITPVTELARSLSIVEAIVGQLFLVVAVSSIVGLNIARRSHEA